MKIDGRRIRVCIDAGHGGKDSGALSREMIKECDVALAVSKELLLQLEKLGIHGYLSRITDEYVSLSERIKRSKEADCLISIHCNAFNGHARGVETIYPKPGKLGKAFANYTQQALMKFVGKEHLDRGIKMSPSPGYNRNLYILRMSEIPTCLTELEFIDHPKWGPWLNTEDVQRGLAFALADGIGKFCKTLPGVELDGSELEKKKPAKKAKKKTKKQARQSDRRKKKQDIKRMPEDFESVASGEEEIFPSFNELDKEIDLDLE